MIGTLCLSQSMPPNFKEILETYTKEGYRVIALAQKIMPDGFNYRKLQTISRDQVESELSFLGLLILENKLKIATTKIIETLRDCEIRTVMATGDNVLTAISVARQCGILDTDKPVYLGEKVTDEQGFSRVQWKSNIDQSATVPENQIDGLIQDRFSSKLFSTVGRLTEQIP